MKLYAICGSVFYQQIPCIILTLHSVGFFLDSYDLFIINLVTPVWTYEYAFPTILLRASLHSSTSNAFDDVWLLFMNPFLA